MECDAVGSKDSILVVHTVEKLNFMTKGLRLAKQLEAKNIQQLTAVLGYVMQRIIELGRKERGQL